MTAMPVRGDGEILAVAMVVTVEEVVVGTVVVVKVFARRGGGRLKG
jgi:hypothetical protein